MAELSPTERVELVEVAELLHGTWGRVTADGILIERVRGWGVDGVRYVDPDNPAEPLKEMSATAYAAEFYKVCGGDLNVADFDDVIHRIEYIGSVLGNQLVYQVGFDTIKVIAGSEKKFESALDYRGCR